ncbi:MAG: helix-turn-helix domain-containing protein [Opitutaceae bacterium]|jgi:DNA-binding IclR family transcriptional regulator|nr:helix-turn-helix domain-containing protein [Opitutaceae bacterium]
MSDNQTIYGNPKQISTTLLRGLDVLSLLLSTGEGLALPEILLAMNEPRSNVLRLLRSLLVYGLVERSGRLWRVSALFDSWGLRGRHQILRMKYRPVLEKIARATGELTLLGLHEGNGMVHLDYIESDHVIRVAPAPQTRHNLRVSAIGKLALSRRPDLCEAITDKRLKRELEEVRKTGVAWNREESVKGMIVLAHPGLNNTPSEPMIAVAWPVFRFSEKKAQAAARSIRSAMKLACNTSEILDNKSSEAVWRRNRGLPRMALR